MAHAQKNNWLPRYPRVIALENLVLLDLFARRRRFFSNTHEPRLDQGFFSSAQKVFLKSRLRFAAEMSFGRSVPVRQSKMTSIFFLTSIFNHSIHSSIAVFYLGPHIHEKWKGRIETWQPRKRQKRRARRNNNSSHQTKRGRASVPFSILA